MLNNKLKIEQIEGFNKVFDDPPSNQKDEFLEKLFDSAEVLEEL